MGLEVLILHLHALDGYMAGQLRFAGPVAEGGIELAEAAPEGADGVPHGESDGRMHRVGLPGAGGDG